MSRSTLPMSSTCHGQCFATHCDVLRFAELCFRIELQATLRLTENNPPLSHPAASVCERHTLRPLLLRSAHGILKNILTAFAHTCASINCLPLIRCEMIFKSAAGNAALCILRGINFQAASVFHEKSCQQVPLQKEDFTSRHGSDGVADRKVTPRTTRQTTKISQPCGTLSYSFSKNQVFKMKI